MMKSTKTLLFAALLSALFLAGCEAEPTIPPVNANDLAAVSGELISVSDAEITPDVPAGVYTTGTEPQTITFAWDNAGGTRTLRWTNNCSTPDADDKTAANGTIPLFYENTGDSLSEQAVLRCAIFENDERVSDVYTFVYTRAAEGRFSMPVVSIVSDKDNLYSYDNGILVAGKLAVGDNPVGWQAWYHAANYYMRGIDWERPIALSVFDETGTLQLSQNAGLRVSGGYTRVNTQKSLRVYARKTYTPETGVFPYAFWGNHRGSATGTPVVYSDTVLFRGGSNNEGSSMFNTPALLLLLDGTYVDTPAIRTVVEYINGRYVGVVTQLEDYDEDYFEHHYGVMKEDLTTMKGSVGEVYEPGGWRVDDGPSTEKGVFSRMIQYILREPMTEEEHYAKACEMLDIRNFIEYFAFEFFIANTDWPQNNMRAWRYNGNDTEDGYNPDAEGVFDGRWRFLAKDLDLSFGFQDSSASPSPYEYMKSNCSLQMKNLCRALMENEEFADLFYTYMCTLAGEVITAERCERIFDLVQVFTGRELAVSASSVGVAGGSRGNWNSGFDRMRQFAISRGSVILRYTKKEADSTLANVTVNVTGEGRVQLGWYDIASGASRQYLRNTRIPLDLYSAEDHAEGTAEITGGYLDEDGYLIVTDASCTVTVVFPDGNKKTEPQGIVLNEVRFRDVETDWIELYNPTDKAVSLDGWMLGKDENPAKAYRIGNTVIEAGGYALCCCTDYSNTAGIEGLSVTMSLGNGDSLYLFDKNGDVADTLALETTSRLIHLGRYPDGGDVTPMSAGEATPAAENVRMDYAGTFSSETFRPYLLAWGRVYELDEYFYEKDGVTYVRREALYALCSERSGNSSLTLWLKKQKSDMPLDTVVAESAAMDGPSLRYVRELDSLILG